MDNLATDLSADLAHELEANAAVDPRSLPVRFSRLKLMSLSAAHYFDACQRGDDGATSLALRLGAGTHAMLFDQPVARFEGKVRNGKAWDSYLADHPDHVILNRREWAEAKRIVDSIRRHKQAMKLLFDGTVRETRIDWSLMGRSCRSTPDALGANHIVDLKSTVSAEPKRFAWQAVRYSYHAQLAFYRHAVLDKFGVSLNEAYIIAVEKTSPHPVTVLRLTDKAIEQGERLVRLWMEALLCAEDANHWGTYTDAIVPFDVPDDDLQLEIDGQMVDL